MAARPRGAGPAWRSPAATDSRGGTREPSRTIRSRAAWNHARSTYQGCGCGMAMRGARAAAAAISGSTNPVRATRPAIPMPKGVSRTSRAMRSAASADARTSSLARSGLPGRVAHIQHHAAADGRHRRKHADDETVSRQQQGRIAQHQPHVRRAARLERSRSFQQPHLGFDLRRSGMEMHRRAVLQRLRRGQKLEPAIHLFDGAEHSRLGERIAARQLRRLDVRQVHRRALAGHGAARRWPHAPGRRARAAAAPRGRPRPPAPWRPIPRPACRWPPCRSLSP